MKRNHAAIAAMLLAISLPAMADTVRVGGQPMFPR
jgi:hypothetical protein